MTLSIEQLSENMKTAMESIRSGESAGRLEDNSDLDTKGRMNVYEPPPGRMPGTINAKWGDTPADHPLNYRGDYGTGTLEKAHDTRYGVLDRAFDGFPEAAAVAKKEVASILEHGARGDYEGRAALLGREKRAEVHVHDEGTLSERVLSVAGFR